MYYNILYYFLTGVVKVRTDLNCNMTKTTVKGQIMSLYLWKLIMWDSEFCLWSTQVKLMPRKFSPPYNFSFLCFLSRIWWESRHFTVDKKRGVCNTLMSQINRLLENLPKIKNIKKSQYSYCLIYSDNSHFHPQEQRFTVKQQSS